MSTLHEILTAAQNLSASDRARLITALWDNVAPTDWLPPDDKWLAEANRRSDSYDAGEMSGAPWSEVRQRARRKAGLDG
ncbi:MAG: addiction module protein [Pirellulaceae bacterium]